MIKDKIEQLFKNDFSKSIIELKLVSDRISEGTGVGSGAFTIKYQMLYLIASCGQTSPQKLISELNMAKSNLALIAKKLINEGLIIQIKEQDNKKQIYYVITEKGVKELSVKMKAIDNLYLNESKELLKYLVKIIDTLKNVK